MRQEQSRTFVTSEAIFSRVYCSCLDKGMLVFSTSRDSDTRITQEDYSVLKHLRTSYVVKEKINLKKNFS